MSDETQQSQPADEPASVPVPPEPMPPEPVVPAQPEPAAPQPESEEEERGERRLWRLLAFIAIVVIIILILLMLTRCGDGDTGGTQGAGKTIVPVTGYDPVPGLVSVWIAEGASIEGVVAEAGVSANSTLDTGDGRFVIEVSAGAESATASKLQGVDGVFDAGLVYEQEGQSNGNATP